MAKWGDKLIFVVYVEGDFSDEDGLFKACEDLDARFDPVFIGVALEPVENEPQDQSAT